MSERVQAHHLDAHADGSVAHVGPPRRLDWVVVHVDDFVQVPRHVARHLGQLLEVEVPAAGQFGVWETMVRRGSNAEAAD